MGDAVPAPRPFTPAAQFQCPHMCKQEGPRLVRLVNLTRRYTAPNLARTLPPIHTCCTVSVLTLVRERSRLVRLVRPVTAARSAASPSLGMVLRQSVWGKRWESVGEV